MLSKALLDNLFPSSGNATGYATCLGGGQGQGVCVGCWGAVVGHLSVVETADYLEDICTTTVLNAQHRKSGRLILH